MHVEKLPSGLWRATVKHGGQRRRTKALATKRAASGAAAQLLLDMMAESDEPARRRAMPAPTVGELVDRHLEQGVWSPTTIVTWERSADRLPASFLRMKVADVTPADVDALYALLGRSWAPSAVKRIHELLSGAFARAVRWRWTRANPCRDAVPPTLARREMSPPSPETWRAIVAVAGTEFAAFLHLAAGTGARRGELMGLRWGDIDLEAGTVRIERGVVHTAKVGTVVQDVKTGRRGRRTVSVDAGTLAAVRRWRVEAGSVHLLAVAASSYLFGFVDRPRLPNWATKRWTQTTERAGITGYRLHDVRHLSASQLLAAGIDPVTVAGRLGHSTPSETMKTYAHVLPARDRAAADVLGRVLGG